MLRTRECAPTFSSFVVFTFRFIVEFVKELGGVSFIVIKHENVNKKRTEKRLWNKIIFQIGVEQIENNGVLLLFIPF
jgi:hypothetical protein